MTDTENIPQGNCEISVKNPPRKSCWGCLAALTVILILLACPAIARRATADEVALRAMADKPGVRMV